MKSSTNFLILSLPLLTAALPAGCGGNLEIIHTNSSTVPRMWTCTSIDTTSLTHFSGDNTLLASYTTSDATTCADACMPLIPEIMAAFWYPSANRCECWIVGDLGSDATYLENGATWIDFESVQSSNAPAAAQDWGVFTCPEGAYRGTIEGIYGWCGWISIEPAAPSLGWCAVCPAAGEWWIEGPGPSCDCYGDLKDAKVSFNYSSPYLLIDRLDFTAPVATSTSKTLATKSSTAKPTSTSTKSSTKSSSKSSSTSAKSSSKKSSLLSSSKATSTSKSLSSTTIKTTTTTTGKHPTTTFVSSYTSSHHRIVTTITQ